MADKKSDPFVIEMVKELNSINSKARPFNMLEVPPEIIRFLEEIDVDLLADDEPFRGDCNYISPSIIYSIISRLYSEKYFFEEMVVPLKCRPLANKKGSFTILPVPAKLLLEASPNKNNTKQLVLRCSNCLTQTRYTYFTNDLKNVLRYLKLKETKINNEIRHLSKGALALYVSQVEIDLLLLGGFLWKPKIETKHPLFTRSKRLALLSEILNFVFKERYSEPNFFTANSLGVILKSTEKKKGDLNMSLNSNGKMVDLASGKWNYGDFQTWVMKSRPEYSPFRKNSIFEVIKQKVYYDVI